MVVQRSRGTRFRRDTLINESERVIERYFNRDIAKKILHEDNEDERLSVLEEYLKENGLDSLWKFFEGYKHEFDNFVEVLKGMFPDIMEELSEKKLKFKKRTHLPKTKTKPMVLTGRKNYSKAEVMFIKSRLKNKGWGVNISLQKEHSEHFGFKRSVGALSSKKSQIRRGKL